VVQYKNSIFIFTFKLNEHTQERRAIEQNLTSGKPVAQARSVHENIPFTRFKFHIYKRTSIIIPKDKTKGGLQNQDQP